MRKVSGPQPREALNLTLIVLAATTAMPLSWERVILSLPR